MAERPDPRPLVAEIERLIQEDVGRHIEPLFAAAAGQLWDAANALSSPQARGVGLITGFYVPQGSPPAAETDGPIGAALLARGFAEIAIPCRLATDAPCRSACAAALAAAGVAAVPVDAVAIGAPLDGVIETWRRARISHALAIERCGCSADGAPRNMRGQDIGAHTAPLDTLFTAGPWQTIAIGDGGNEIGMGALPRELIARHVAHGERIACTTAARHLIVAGVSNWGAYGLLGALAAIREDWRAPLIGCLDEALDRAVLEATVTNGPAVDGVSLRQTPTVDNLPIAVHHEKLRRIRMLAQNGHER